MKEHGLLFNADMVRALRLSRKTQTRRIVDAHNSLVDGSGISKKRWLEAGFDLANAWIDNGPSPAGNTGQYLKAEHVEGTVHRIYPRLSAGDHIYVKETWGVVSHVYDASGNRREWTPDRPAISIVEMPFGQGFYHGHVIYAADGPFEWAGDDGMGEPRAAWKPSIHMPRRAARLVLEVVSVRPERLNDISEADAEAEGIELTDDFEIDGERLTIWNDAIEAPTAKDAFEALWESINGADSWTANPWVWVYEFQRVESAH